MGLVFLILVASCSAAPLVEEDVEIVDTEAEVGVRVVESRKITGKDCEYISLCQVINTAGCADGDYA